MKQQVAFNRDLLFDITAVGKLVVFDMDNTLLQGRFIDTLAKKFLFDKELNRLRHTESRPAVLTKKIASLLKGLSVGELLETAAAIPIVEDAQMVVKELKSRGCTVGIISDSYHAVTEYIKSKIGADFSFANQLISENNLLTGEVVIPPVFLHAKESICSHEICKTNTVINLCRILNITIEETVCVGDSENDLCMIQHAGVGVAFCTNTETLRKHADVSIDEPSFKELLNLTYDI